MSKKPVLSASLVAVKGAAAPVQGMPARSPSIAEPKPPSTPLNFKVPEDFVREFKIRAATRGLKLNELLLEAFEAHKRLHGE